MQAQHSWYGYERKSLQTLGYHLQELHEFKGDKNLNMQKDEWTENSASNSEAICKWYFMEKGKSLSSNKVFLSVSTFSTAGPIPRSNCPIQNWEEYNGHLWYLIF